MPKKHRKSEENRLFQKTRIQTILDKHPWDSTAIFIFFCYFSVPSLNSSAFSKFSCSSPSPHPIQSWDSGKNSGYTRPTLFVGWGEELGLCELENAPEMQNCPKTFVHDCSPWIPLWTWAWTTSMDHPYFWRWILLEVFKTNLKNLK